MFRLVKVIFKAYTHYSINSRSNGDNFILARVTKGRKTKRCAMDIYNTVWLSDFESSMKSFGSRSGFSSLNQSQISFSENSGKIVHSTPKSNLSKASKCLSEDESCSNSRVSSKMRLHRTLSLPESDLPHINGEDLQERFTRLQLEQENRELRFLTRQLQEALEKLEERLMIDIKLRESEKKPCPKCSSTKPNVSSEVIVKPLDVNSPDSLEESSCKNKIIDFNNDTTNPKEFLKIKDKNESGYSTFINESLSGSINDDDSLKTNSEESFTRKGYHYMEYSEDCTSEEERQFYKSRLARKRKQQYDNSVCCITQ